MVLLLLLTLHRLHHVPLFRLLLCLSLISNLPPTGADLSSDYSIRGTNIRSRKLGSTRSTSECNAIRMPDDYGAQLQLTYVYQVEFEGGSDSYNLDGMQDAIVVAVADALNDCDWLGRPKYQVKTTTRHQVSKEEFCAPSETGNICNVVNGATVVLLDSQSAIIQERAYIAIAKGINNTKLIHQYASNVVRAEFLRELQNSLLASGSSLDTSDSAGIVAATVAIAGASVSFLVASMFCYGILRGDIRFHSEPSTRHRKPRAGAMGAHVVRNVQLQNQPVTHRRPFMRLEEIVDPPDYECEENFDPEVVAGAMERVPWPQTFQAMSVSDMTSDSYSIQSGISLTASRLDRIEEEEWNGSQDGLDGSIESREDAVEDEPINHRRRETSLTPRKHQRNRMYIADLVHEGDKEEHRLGGRQIVNHKECGHKETMDTRAAHVSELVPHVVDEPLGCSLEASNGNVLDLTQDSSSSGSLSNIAGLDVASEEAIGETMDSHPLDSPANCVSLQSDSVESRTSTSSMLCSPSRDSIGKRPTNVVPLATHSSDTEFDVGNLACVTADANDIENK